MAHGGPGCTCTLTLEDDCALLTGSPSTSAGANPAPSHTPSPNAVRRLGAAAVDQLCWWLLIALEGSRSRAFGIAVAELGILTLRPHAAIRHWTR